MKFNDAVFGLLLLVLGVTVLFIVQDYPTIPGQQVGPALFPGLIAAGLCVGGLMLLVRGWRMRESVPWLVFDDWIRSPRHKLALAVLLGSVLFYILVSQWLGFLISAVLILVGMLLLGLLEFTGSLNFGGQGLQGRHVYNCRAVLGRPGQAATHTGQSIECRLPPFGGGLVPHGLVPTLT